MWVCFFLWWWNRACCHMSLLERPREVPQVRPCLVSICLSGCASGEASPVSLRTLFSFPGISSSHRSERSELSIGEEIEEDLSVGVDELNASDKVGQGP